MAGLYGLIRTTLLDFPGKVACTVFLPGCHLRCPFCHNPELVDGSESGEVLGEDFESLKSFLEKRKRVLGGVAFTGGEPLLHPDFSRLVHMVRKFGLAVKLDTAGLLPDRLAEADADYIAMDLKTAPDRYGELGWRGEDAEERLRRSVAHLIESNRDHELRTTVVPGLVGPEELPRMAAVAQGVKRWILQPYRRGRTLDPDWSDLTPVDDETLRHFAENLRSRGFPIALRS